MDAEVQLAPLASAAAVALVTEMAKAGWAGVRELANRLFRRAGEQEQARQLARLDADSAQIGVLDRAEVEERWRRRLLTLAEDYPEVIEDLSLLASRVTKDQDSAVHQTANGNIGPVIQVGRDNSGEINIGEARP
ncbi:hypothetical protein [Actinocatenispora rupis]|uniref:Uncharacterized protein n=1 Tax=Actinocatenispora rupis TaxID=519421 RepID=A0A8J3JJY1_9ACTN|nr:hypothetical protein [Actinocatenispora rupis]GID16293.1 hypothetical protein Aru02nite_71820 [Actinocatenispora rupis]